MAWNENMVKSETAPMLWPWYVAPTACWRGVLGYLPQFIHIARQPAVVDAHDRLGLLCHEATHMLGADVKRIWLNVREDRLCPDVQ